MRDYNIGKIIARADYNLDTVIGKNSYRVIETYGGWEIYRCLTEEVGKEWMDCEGNRFTGWKLHTFVPVEDKVRYLRAFQDYLSCFGKKMPY